MKLKHYIIFSIIVIVTSAATAFGGYFYGSLIAKKKAELDKEAAVKGAVYDVQEKLNKEAVQKVEEVVGEVTNKSSSEAKKVLEQFFVQLEAKNYEEAYKFLSADYKRSIYSANAITKEFSYADEIKQKSIEFRSSGDSSAMFAVALEGVSEETYFVRLTKDLTETWKIESIELKDKKQNFNSAWGSNG